MVVIAGGTGRLGTRVVESLTKQRIAVRVMTRDKARAAHLPDSIEVVEGDVRDPLAVKEAVAGAQHVVSAVQGLDDRNSSPDATDRDGNRNLVDAAKAASVAHFIFVSAPSGPDHPMSMGRAKYAAEQYLKASGLAWTIVRPTAFMEFWAELVGRPVLETGRTRVFGRGRNPINFVSIADVATAVVRAVTDAGMRGVELNLGGPENLTILEVVETFERIAGKEAKVSHVPLPAMRAMKVMARPFNPAFARIVEAGIAMDTTDMSWDPEPNRTLYPWLPQTRLAEVISPPPL
jgi:NADH dehydrogenase